MRNPPAVGSWLYLPIHRGRPHRNCASQLFPRHCAARHLLRCRPLPLCPLNGGSIRYYCCIRSLIPPVLRIHPPQHLNKNSLWHYIRGCQPNIFPTTLPRSCWYASSILRLPRRLYSMKYCLFFWLSYLTSRCNYVPFYYLRSFLRKTRNSISRVHCY